MRIVKLVPCLALAGCQVCGKHAGILFVPGACEGDLPIGVICLGTVYLVLLATWLGYLLCRATSEK